ncbi:MULTISPECIES: autotransporter assembly complex protein TamA [Pacificimonas]|uniref:autotransporter assembly complex protein TamA n=1 Tax=Pacificimonas TaxID=1960290 RepID=UPI001CCA620C|nr:MULTISPECIES: BamA/TamA family outer membrane protein [Pacificimonas]
MRRNRGFLEIRPTVVIAALAVLGLPVAPGAAQQPLPDAEVEGDVPASEPGPGTSGTADADDVPEPVEPSIGDDEFGDALPDLDDDAFSDFSRSLERAERPIPVAETELAAEESEAEAAAAEENGAEEVDSAFETIEPVEIREDVLAQPLVPLQELQVTDLAEAEAVEEDAPLPEVRYYLAIEGLEDVGLEGEFLDASALDEGDGSADNAAMLRARANADEELAKRLLDSRGYFDAAVGAEVILPPEPDGRYRVLLAVSPGEQYTFSDVSIVGEDEAIPPRLVSDNLPIEAGDPIVADEVISAEASIDLVFPFNGYPFAEVEQRAILLDEETKTGDYVLPVDLGPRSRFRNIETEGDLAFDQEHVELLARFDEGDLYDVRMEDDLREAMIATGLFNSVSIEPLNTRDYNEDGTMAVDLLVRQDAGPSRTLSAELGYGTGEGARIEGGWTHRNLFPPEGELDLRATVGTREQGAAAIFRRSNAGERDRTVLLGVEAGRSDFPAYNAYTLSLRGRVSKESTPIWQKRWSYAYGAELIATNESQDGDPAIFDFDTAFLIGAVSGLVTYDASNSLLNPTKGWKASLRLSPEAALGGGDVRPYIVSQVDLSGYFPVSQDLTIAGRVRIGSINGISRDEIAPSRRLYGGGGGSVRGYGFQEIGPARVEITPPDPDDPDDTEPDIDYQPIGGRSVNEAAIEARYRFGNFGVVGFVDAGQVYTEQYPQFGDLQYGAGIGGRYYTNFGPFRLDLAIPLNKQPGQSDWAVYVSIGQAF